METTLLTFSQEYFEQPAPLLARCLLNQWLVRVIDNQVLIGKIVETEAYLSQGDEAAHSHRGITPRNEVMFGPPGFSYVYRIHQHHCLNVVAEEPGSPGCVLIRALEPVQGQAVMFLNRPLKSSQSIIQLTNGPGKLCQALDIKRVDNGLALFSQESSLFIAQGDQQSATVNVSPRIGISQAKELLLRFYIKDNPYVSR